MAKKSTSKTASAPAVDRAAHGSALVSAAGEMLKVAARIQEIAATLERECDQAKCERKYGKGLIRVDWQYARNGFINPTLKHVCTWANGDEGFVPNATSAATRHEN